MCTPGHAGAAGQDCARRAEDIGLRRAARARPPRCARRRFPALTAVAMATSTLRVGTFVLNAAFYQPALLARDVAALRDLSDGRLRSWGWAPATSGGVRGRRDPVSQRRRAGRPPEATTEYLGEHAARRADHDRRQRRPGAAHRGALGPHHRADRWRPGGVGRRGSAGRADRVRARKRPADRFDDLELNLAITAMPSTTPACPTCRSRGSRCPGCPTRSCCAIRACCRDRRARSPTDPPLPRRLRHQLHHRADASRRGVREGDGAAQVALIPPRAIPESAGGARRRGRVSSLRQCPRSSGDRARLS